MEVVTNDSHPTLTFGKERKDLDQPSLSEAVEDGHPLGGIHTWSRLCETDDNLELLLMTPPQVRALPRQRAEHGTKLLRTCTMRFDGNYVRKVGANNNAERTY